MLQLMAEISQTLPARDDFLIFALHSYSADEADISNRQFRTRSQGAIRSFTPDNLRLMYHLLEPQVIYNRKFIETFVEENSDPTDCTHAWLNNEEKIKKDKNGMYTNASIFPPYSFVVAMLCRLFGRPDSTKFSPHWLSLIEEVVNATSMNWAQILSDNLAKTIIEYRRRRSIASRVYRPFFMSAYVMDAICFSSKFPIMGWKWTVWNPLPIHVYHKVMWESNYQPHFFKICHGVMLPIYKWLYNRDAP